MTSGATGEPKMGVVSHRALVTNLDMTPDVLPLTPDDCTIAFLPSAHMAQRMVGELLPVYTGSAVWFSEGLSKLPHELRAVRPTFFLSPPRLWERIYASIIAEIKKRPAALRKLFYLGLGLGSKAAKLRREGRPVPAGDPGDRFICSTRSCSRKFASDWAGALRAPISGSRAAEQGPRRILRSCGNAAPRRLRADRRRRRFGESTGPRPSPAASESCFPAWKLASRKMAS